MSAAAVTRVCRCEGSISDKAPGPERAVKLVLGAQYGPNMETAVAARPLLRHPADPSERYRRLEPNAT